MLSSTFTRLLPISVYSEGIQSFGGINVRVKILEHEFELANQLSAIEQLFTVIEEKLKDTGYAFTSLTIDGVKIETDYVLYLSQRINDIQEIEVGVTSFRTLLAETMVSAGDYLERARPEVEKLGGEFYQGPTEESWQKFAQLLEGLQWLLEVVTTIESCQPGKQTILGRGADFGEKIDMLQDALQNSDHVLLGDLLQYEISPLFSTLEKEIKELLNTEGYKDDLN